MMAIDGTTPIGSCRLMSDATKIAAAGKIRDEWGDYRRLLGAANFIFMDTAGRVQVHRI
jgi:hypothetical protein